MNHLNRGYNAQQDRSINRNHEFERTLHRRECFLSETERELIGNIFVQSLLTVGTKYYSLAGSQEKLAPFLRKDRQMEPLAKNKFEASEKTRIAQSIYDEFERPD